MNEVLKGGEKTKKKIMTKKEKVRETENIAKSYSSPKEQIHL